MDKSKRKPSPSDTLWRKAGITAVAAFTVGGGAYLLNNSAFDLGQIRKHYSTNPHAGKGNSIYDVANSNPDEIPDIFTVANNLRNKGASYDDFLSTIQKDAAGLNCTQGQHPDPNDPNNKWEKSKIQRVYSGAVNAKTSFSPVYYCQLPTGYRAHDNAGTQAVDYNVADASNDLARLAASEYQNDQKTLDHLTAQCGGVFQRNPERPKDWDHCREFSSIVKNEGVTSPFGPRVSKTVIKNADGKATISYSKEHVHLGIDLRAHMDQSVRAAYDGIVVTNTGNAHQVLIEHKLPDGRLAYSEYMHLNTVSVRPGQVVKAGQKIGASGNYLAGQKLSPHLHYGEWFAIDPKKDPSTGPHFLDWRKMVVHKETGTYLSRDDFYKYKKVMPINPDRNCIGVAMGGSYMPSPAEEQDKQEATPPPPGTCDPVIRRVDDALIAEAFPKASPEGRAALNKAINRALQNPSYASQFNTREKLSMFFAQISEETGGTLVKEESLDYRPTALIGNWPKRFNVQQALQYGRIDEVVKKDMTRVLGSNKPKDQANKALVHKLGLYSAQQIRALPNHRASQIVIAGLAYGNRMRDLGNGPGIGENTDSWRYRGRGPVQVTGKGNYDHVTKEVNSYFLEPGQKVDYVVHPELLLKPEHGAYASVAYWKKRNIGGLIDAARRKGASDETVLRSVTKKINGGLRNI